VDFKPGPKIEVGMARLLWSSPLTSEPRRHLWAVSRDGQRVLIRTMAGGAARGV